MNTPRTAAVDRTMNQKLRIFAAAAALLTLPGSARAGTVQVTVTVRDSRPAADVVVLIESANRKAATAARAPVVIEQQNLKFVPFLTVVPVGSTLRFVNRDSYDHHVRATPSGPLGGVPPVTSFELRLDPAEGAPAAAGADYKSPTAAQSPAHGSSADVRVDKPGAIGLGCHIHASMRGQVYVSGTPWYGKTDSNGMVSIDGVPDGDAEVKLWHPDQLQEQPALAVQVSAAPATAAARLNFAPRRRRN